jgi:hypothetical protein
MGKNQSASNLTNIIKQDANGNISFVSGSTTLMSVSSSGAITTTGNVAGTASYASNAELFDGLDSTVFTLTSSFAAQTASFTAFTASQNILNGTYATTGSNTFTGIQTINSNLVVTGSITAQTLVVQTVTSSVVYSSGSNVFGNNIANTQVFTGSVSITGSTNLTGALSGTSATFSGNVGVGANPNQSGIGSSNRVLTVKAASSGGEALLELIGLGNNATDNIAKISFMNQAATTALASIEAIRGSSDTVGELSIKTSNTTRLTIASTGAATFSSSVTANGLYANAGNSVRFYRGANDFYWGINNDSNNYLNFGTFAANGTAYGTNPKLILLDNGNVGIGTSSPNAGLEVVTDSGAFNALRLVSNRAYNLNTDVALVFRYLYDSTNYTTGGLIVVTKDNNTISNQSGNMQFYTNNAGSNAERMRITSAGQVGIGVTPSNWSTGKTLEIGGSYPLALHNSNAIGNLLSLNAYYNGSWYYTATNAAILYIQDTEGHKFFSNGSGTANTTFTPAERMRITSGGIVQITNAGSLVNSVQIYPTANAATSGTSAFIQLNQSFGIAMDTISSVEYGAIGGNSAMGGILFRTYSGSYAYRFFFYANGTAYNSTGTWGNSSDIRLKQNIVDANSQWDDIKALKFKKYRFKKDVQNELESTNGYVAPTHFGLIAQDVELTSPGLVEEVDSEDGNKTKMLKTSIMLMKSVKALQEAMQRIETLETENNTLKEILQRNNIQ